MVRGIPQAAQPTLLRPSSVWNAESGGEKKTDDGRRRDRPWWVAGEREREREREARKYCSSGLLHDP